MKVKLISTTSPCIDGIEDAEGIITYCARVSNPSNQMATETAPRLLNYLIKHKHWSPFEMASMCVEIETSRGIAPQILRHKSFGYQEFSQRYQKVTALNDMMEPLELRKSGATNRQSSLEIDNPGLSEEATAIATNAIDVSTKAYEQLLGTWDSP